MKISSCSLYTPPLFIKCLPAGNIEHPAQKESLDVRVHHFFCDVLKTVLIGLEIVVMTLTTLTILPLTFSTFTDEWTRIYHYMFNIEEKSVIVTDIITPVNNISESEEDEAVKFAILKKSYTEPAWDECKTLRDISRQEFDKILEVFNPMICQLVQRKMPKFTCELIKRVLQIPPTCRDILFTLFKESAWLVPNGHYNPFLDRLELLHGINLEEEVLKQTVQNSIEIAKLFSGRNAPYYTNKFEILCFFITELQPYSEIQQMEKMQSITTIHGFIDHYSITNDKAITQEKYLKFIKKLWSLPKDRQEQVIKLLSNIQSKAFEDILHFITVANELIEIGIICFHPLAKASAAMNNFPQLPLEIWHSILNSSTIMTQRERFFKESQNRVIANAKDNLVNTWNDDEWLDVYRSCSSLMSNNPLDADSHSTIVSKMMELSSNKRQQVIFVIQSLDKGNGSKPFPENAITTISEMVDKYSFSRIKGLLARPDLQKMLNRLSKSEFRDVDVYFDFTLGIISYILAGSSTLKSRQIFHRMLLTLDSFLSKTDRETRVGYFKCTMFVEIVSAHLTDADFVKLINFSVIHFPEKDDLSKIKLIIFLRNCIAEINNKEEIVKLTDELLYEIKKNSILKKKLK